MDLNFLKLVYPQYDTKLIECTPWKLFWKTVAILLKVAYSQKLFSFLFSPQKKIELSSTFSLLVEKLRIVQVNLCQKFLFLHQLTHNMTTDCWLIYQFSTWKLQAQNMERTCSTHVFHMFWACSFHVLNW